MLSIKNLTFNNLPIVDWKIIERKTYVFVLTPKNKVKCLVISERQYNLLVMYWRYILVKGGWL